MSTAEAQSFTSKPHKRINLGRAAADRREYEFAALIISGKPQTEAAILAGFSPKSAVAKASQLMRRPRVIHLIQAERDKISKRRDISVGRIAEEFASIGLATMQSFVNVDADGTAKYDLNKADEVDWRAVQQVTLDKDKNVVAVKLHDKNTSLMNLAKLCGFIKDAGREKDDGTEPAEDMGEVARRLAFVMRNGQRQIEAKPGPAIPVIDAKSDNVPE